MVPKGRIGAGYDRIIIRTSRNMLTCRSCREAVHPLGEAEDGKSDDGLAPWRGTL